MTASENITPTVHDILLARNGGVATICFNRPAKLNALTAEMSRDFLAMLRALGDEPEIKVIILTGAGRAFCVGGDLTLEDSFTALTFQRELELFAETVLAILSCPQPIICQLNGDAIGWGATIALFCDIVIAKHGARLGDPHVNVGLSTGDGASVIWPQLAGYARAKQLLLTGELISVTQAERYGLVNEVVDPEDIDDRVLTIAHLIESKPQLAVSMTKASINIPLKNLVRASMDTYIAYELATQQHPDHAVAVDSFLQRRKP
ncbi:MAG: 3-hydroxypropionyl-CoA dehydratase [Sphingomonadales bacterium]|nr:3-hydroxypropionyl-CoA dehydratase [Sphingomonadales bacterium]